MFNEKIFIFLWFWFVFVLLMTIYSLFAWMLRMLFARQRRKFICRYLKLMQQMSRSDMKMAHKFVENVLRPDGVFVIRMIAEKAGTSLLIVVMASDLRRNF